MVLGVPGDPSLSAAGFTDTGVALDSWKPTTRSGAPSARSGHTTVWTGTRLIVWGGTGASGNVGTTYLDTGGQYDPATDSWTPMSRANAPAGRFAHTAVWDGTHMIVWGGRGSSGATNSGGRYDPVSDSWRPMRNPQSVPSARYDHSAVWTGSHMVVWGGRSALNTGPTSTGGLYDPISDAWRPTSADTPAAYGHAAVWTGDRMMVWGGNASALGTSVRNTGGLYDPATNRWFPTTTVGAPAARTRATAIWTGTEAIIWGGFNLLAAGGDVGPGGRYDPTLDEWTAVSTRNAPEPRWGHGAVSTGLAMIVWGGAQPPGAGASLLSSGGYYDLATDRWDATSLVNAPSATAQIHAAWTGSEMVVWGTDGGSNVDRLSVPGTGGRYRRLHLFRRN
jgi:hypothetical protein